MKILLTAIALAIGAAPSLASAAPVSEDGVITLEGRGAQAAAVAPRPFVTTSPPCGSSSNAYECIVVRASSDTVVLPSFLQSFSAKGVATVTWQGTVTCYTSPRILFISGAISRAIFEYYLYLGLKDTATNLDTNGPDTVTVGEKSDVVAPQNNIMPPVNNSSVRTPITLTKSFKITAAGARRYRVALIPSFLSYGEGGMSCGIYGGVYTVQYIPD